MHKRVISALAVVTLGTASSADAALLYALNTANQLVSFDSATPGATSAPVLITQAGIVDIDFSPANGRLYGFTSVGNAYFVDPTTGLATLAASPLTALTGVNDADFNPAADRLRIFAGVNNFRMTLDASSQTAPTLTQAAGTVTSDGTFSIAAFNLVANAYDNNFDNVGSTNLYSIDTNTDALVLHSGTPQFNTVAAVGPLNVNVGTAVGFDVGQNGIAYVSNGNALYTANMGTGALSPAGSIGILAGSVTSIAAAAVPEPATATVALGAAGLLALRARRRRGVGATC